MKRNKLFLITIFMIALTPLFNNMANQTREKPGYGGECLIWLLPYFIHGLYTTYQETKDCF